jgi:hypothetical protein
MIGGIRYLNGVADEFRFWKNYMTRYCFGAEGN